MVLGLRVFSLGLGFRGLWFGGVPEQRDQQLLPLLGLSPFPLPLPMRSPEASRVLALHFRRGYDDEVGHLWEVECGVAYVDRVDLVGAFSLGNAARVAIYGIRHVSSSRFASQGVRFHLCVKLSSRRWPHLQGWVSGLSKTRPDCPVSGHWHRIVSICIVLVSYRITSYSMV